MDPVYAGQSAYLTLPELPTLEMGTGTSPSVGGVPTLQTDLTQVGKDLKMWLPKSVLFAYGKMVSPRPPTEPYLSRKNKALNSKLMTCVHLPIGHA